MEGKEEGIGQHERYGMYNDIEIIQIFCLWMGMWKSGIGGWIGEAISPFGGQGDMGKLRGGARRVMGAGVHNRRIGKKACGEGK